MTSHSNSIVPADPAHYPESLLCPICWAVPTPLVVTMCNHAFCAPCLQASMEQRKQCPQCRKRCSNGAQQSSKSRNALAFRIWSRLAVKCEEPGCGWTGAAEDGAQHVSQRHRGVVAGVSEAREPPPATTTTIHNSNDGPDQIVIENASALGVNGTYTQHGYFQEACMYRKTCGDDNDNRVLIFRHDHCRWRIAVAPARGNQICYYETSVDPVNPAWPPRTGWWGFNDQEQALTLLFRRHDGTSFMDGGGAKDENDDNESDTDFSTYTIEDDDGDNDDDDDLEESSMETEDIVGFGSDSDFEG